MPTDIQSVPLWLTIVGFLLMLGPLVTLHELGHYLAGRWCGVRAVAFSVGFGKELIGRTDKHGTRWRLSLLPLGGYVQFKGDMNPAGQASDEYLAMPEAEKAQCFQSARLWQKALIVAAGPVTNLLIAIAIFAAFFMAYGKPVAGEAQPEVTIAAFAEDSAAQDAGLRVGDAIVALDGEAVEGFFDLRNRVFMYPNRTFAVAIVRGGERLTIPVTTRSEEQVDQFGNKMMVALLGIQPVAPQLTFQPVGLPEALGLAVGQCVDAARMMVTAVGQIFAGDRSVKELGGPISMAQMSGQQLSLGWPEFVSFVAFISLNLAFINLLPIPVLDGGHLAFYAAEAVRRRPASARSQELAFRTGMALVLGLMLFVTIVDLAKLPVFGG